MVKTWFPAHVKPAQWIGSTPVQVARQQQQIQSLQQALQRLSEQQQQHPVPLVPSAVAAAPEDGQPGAGHGDPVVTEIVK